MNSREIVFSILKEVYSKGAYANIALSQYLQRCELSDQDRRFITEMVYGIVKAGDTLVWIIKKFINKPIHKLDADVLIILRMGVYQCLFMDKVPPSAACNESVKLAKKVTNQGAANFVNGVLRALLRNPEKAALPTGNKAIELSVREQHPLWLVKAFIKEFGSEAAIKLCEFDNTSAPLVLRTNTLKITREHLLQELKNEGCIVKKTTKASEGIICEEHGALNKLKPLQEGYAQVQDESSMLVASVVDPQPGEIIIDTCSAPGGKTTHLAEKMGNKGEILAGDIHEHKLKLIEDNAKRLGISIIKTQTWDATTIGDLYPEKADRILVDAPCSGIGVLRRKPDSRWNKTPELLVELPKLQLDILTSASKAVKPGGVLVYSTCTIMPQENQKVVEAFLLKHPEFELEDVNKFLPYKHKGSKKVLQLLPHKDNTDGFFIARMHKKHKK